MIELEDPGYQLDATLDCTGVTLNNKGVSICQSKAGLIQHISFAEEVKTAFDSKCQMATSDNKTFEYVMAKGQCYFVFKGAQVHRLTTLGYEKILIRGE